MFGLPLSSVAIWAIGISIALVAGGGTYLFLKRRRGRAARVTKRVLRFTVKAERANTRRVENKPVKRAAKRAKWITIGSGIVGLLQAIDQGKRNQQAILNQPKRVTTDGPPPSAKERQQSEPPPPPPSTTRPLVATLRQREEDVSPETQQKLRTNGKCGHYIKELNRLCHNPQWGGQQYCWVDGHDQLAPAPGAKQDQPRGDSVAGQAKERRQEESRPDPVPQEQEPSPGQQVWQGWWVLSVDPDEGTMTPHPATDRDQARQIRGQEQRKGHAVQVVRNDALDEELRRRVIRAHKTGTKLTPKGEVAVTKLNPDGSAQTDSRGRVVYEPFERVEVPKRVSPWKASDPDHHTSKCLADLDGHPCQNLRKRGFDHCYIGSHAGKRKLATGSRA